MTHEDAQNLYLLELIAVRAQMAQLIKPEQYFQAVDFIHSLHERLIEPVVRCEDCEQYSSGICWHPYITGSCDCDLEKEPDGYCDWGKRKDGGSND
jgi:hypothetical protein